MNRNISRARVVAVALLFMSLDSLAISPRRTQSAAAAADDGHSRNRSPPLPARATCNRAPFRSRQN